MPAERKVRFNPLLDGEQPQLVEALDLEPRERLKLEVGQRPTAPEQLRLAQHRCGPSGVAVLERLPAVAQPLLERLQIQFALLDPQHVPRRSRE